MALDSSNFCWLRQGVAIDVHVWRAMCNLGVLSPLMGIEHASVVLKSVYNPIHFRKINHVHGSIAQMLRERCHGQLVEGMLALSTRFGRRHGIPGWRDAVTAMLSHYPTQII